MLRIRLGLLLAPLLAFSSAGCFFDADDDDDAVIVIPERFGTLTTEWFVAGSQDPAACFDFGIDRFELLIYDAFGTFVTEAEAPCEAFALSVELPDGLYFADATLVDAFDRSVTVTKTLEDIDIIPDTELVVTVDFPVTSLLSNSAASSGDASTDRRRKQPEAAAPSESAVEH